MKSAVEGSEDALAQLQKGAGAGSYKSAIKAEVGNRDMSFQPSQIKQIDPPFFPCHLHIEREKSPPSPAQNASGQVASIASAAAELISAKMKRAATRDAALKTLRALSWNPPATLPALPALL